MDFYDYDVWLRLFFNQVQTQHLPTVSESIWTYHRQPTKWEIQVKTDYQHLFPYAFSVTFDLTNCIMTINPQEWNEKSIKMFLHVHAELLRFLTQHNVSCFIRTSTESVFQRLYSNQSFPLIPVGETSKKLYTFLETMKTICKESALLFTPAFGLFFHAALFPNNLWCIRLATNGIFYVDDKPYETPQELANDLAPLQQIVQNVEQKEQELLAYACQWHEKNYYDPFTRTLVFFQKHLFFSCTVQLKPHTYNVRSYTFQFDSFIKKGEDLNVLTDQLKAKIKQYYYQHRVHAAIENKL